MPTKMKTRSGVAAGHGETARAAAEILDAGGNAFDAAIAGFLAACVVEPVLASLGGGGFMVAHQPDKPTRAIDFFTQTPKKSADATQVEFDAITADFGSAQQEFHIGLGSVATPGAVAGIFDIHKMLGRLPMGEIIKPAVGLATAGVPINAFQAYLLTVVKPIYVATSEAREMYCQQSATNDQPEIKTEGETIKFHDFADFLEALASEGADLFYKGEIAERISAFSGCTIGKEDLAAYEVIHRAPLISEINRHEVAINPPPAIGGALITLAMSMLDQAKGNFSKFGDAEHLKHLVSIIAACNDARAKSGIDHDPLTGAEMLTQVVDHPPAYRGTTHISTADRDGNVAVMTVSNGEGCGSIIPGTGVMLNNMLGEDDLNAHGFFNWPTGTRMSSMMSPGILHTLSDDIIGFGSGGSNRIRSAITQFILNVAIFGMDITDAVESPRLHLEGAKLDIEPDFPGAGIRTLCANYEDTRIWPEQNMFFGGVHAIQVSASGAVSGAGDPRRGGVFIPV